MQTGTATSTAGALALLLLVALPTQALAIDPVFSSGRGLAIRGYDPVAYFSAGKPVEGSGEHSFEWKGATWRFASAENRKRFTADPSRYAPQYGGYCAYAVAHGTAAATDPEAWRIVDDKLYLNLDRDIQALWMEDVPGFIRKADDNWPMLLAED